MGSSEIIPTYPNTIRILPAFSSRPLTAEAMVLSQASPCAICGGQKGTGERFAQSFPLAISLHQPTPYNGAVNTTPPPYYHSLTHTHSLSLSLSHTHTHSTLKSWCPNSQRRASDRTFKINGHLTILYVRICKHLWIQVER